MPAGTLILAATLSLVTLDDPVADTVDIIELNHCYNGFGDHTSDWWIFWRWDGWEHHVGAWRSRCRGDVLVRSGRGTVLHKRDRIGYRRIVALEFRETWTTYDPEILDSYVLPKHLRCGLTPLEIPGNICEEMARGTP